MDSSMLDHIIQFVPSKMRRKQLNLLRQKTSKKSKRLLLHALISNLRIGITNQDRLNDALSLLPEKVLASEINSYPNSKLIIFALNQCICKQSNIMRYLSDSIITGDNAITCCRMNILHSQFVPAELNNNLLVLYKLLTIGQRLPESVIFKLLDLLKQLDNAESLRACQMCLCLALNLKSIDTLQRIHFIDDTNYILKYSCLRTQILSTDDSRINYCKMNDFIVDATNICTLKFTESLLEKGCNVLLEGPDGCGKSVMIDFLASFHKRKIVRIQMSEGVDLKEFIGTYHFTADNKVMWIPGAFSKAVIRPCWLIIEDIDLCPPDVLSFLCSIMNNRTFVQSCTEEEVKLHSQFRIVFTYRTTFGKNSSQKNFILSTVRSICCVQMPALNTNSIETIVKSRFPFLHQLTDQIMEVFALLKHYIQSSSLLNRNIGVRDIIKLCDRLKLEHEIEENLFTFDFAVKAFKHCLDCWVSWIPSSVRRFEISRQIGACFSISCEKVNDILRGNGNAKFLNKELICDRGRFELYGRAKSLFCQTPRILNLIVSIYISCLQQESVLLCGETGVGKTSLLQHLSELAGIKLLVVNLSTQTEINDLLGGYKPTDYNTTIRSFWSDFTILFQQCYDSEKNEKFIHILKQYFKKQDWLKLLKAVERPILDALNKKDSNSSWINIYEKQKRLLACIENARLTFEFIEGPIIKAYKEGYWLLLDEINLASAETLFALSTILNRDMIYGANQDLISCSPNFRLFASMNPSTDLNKKELPPGLRNRFTEFFIDEPEDRDELKCIAEQYLKSNHFATPAVDLYFNLKHICEGTSMTCNLRSFCRSFIYANALRSRSFLRSIYEGFAASFVSQCVNANSRDLITKIIRDNLFKNVENAKSILKQPLPIPTSNDKYEKIGGYWILRGSNDSTLDDTFDRVHVFTGTVQNNLEIICRLVTIRKFPLLLQGETSVGKTSLIKWLAKKTGNILLTINNHEHTDIQEYTGFYSPDLHSKQLKFNLGTLAIAMERGYWILLDELNLAPSPVLEAFNRVLDDNRELFIPEINKTICAHKNFVIFATQNPTATGYAGRKPLSKALRSRFIEITFEQLGSTELEEILVKKQSMPASYAHKMVTVLKDLESYRSSTFLFRGKSGLMTLRDLFRWSNRFEKACSLISNDIDWLQFMADMGYLLIASKTRNDEDAVVIQKTIEQAFNRIINVESLYDFSSASVSFLLKQLIAFNDQSIVMTKKIKRTLLLLELCYLFDEPALLVGATGCGKTTACYLLSNIHQSTLTCVNCHLQSEASDFLGSIRSAGNGTFKWVDGPIVSSMKNGGIFLLDEISLAEDSVLERLNSVLDSDRTIRLTDLPCNMLDDQLIKADKNFRFFATMNPGGDYGKKELSPALRNRFTEIWCPSILNSDEIDLFCKQSLNQSFSLVHEIRKFILNCTNERIYITIRDLIHWFEFINQMNSIDERLSCVHGAFMTFVGTQFKGLLSQFRQELNISENMVTSCSGPEYRKNEHETFFGIEPFFIKTANNAINKSGSHFVACETSCHNMMMILRALQIRKPILLEGDPALGKTSIVHFLADATGNGVVRINLSDQTDVADLFGCELPSKDHLFTWSDGPLITALKQGAWIIFDELNLAPQSILEALNACLDFRGSIYVPELDRSFSVEYNNTRIFATQNPHGHSGRKGLPKSFLNRFTTIQFESFSTSDYRDICLGLYPSFHSQYVDNLIKMNEELSNTMDCNLRDLLRWCDIAINTNIHRATNLIYKSRTTNDCQHVSVENAFYKHFRENLLCCSRRILIKHEKVFLGNGITVDRNAMNICEMDAQRLKLNPFIIEKLQFLCEALNHGYPVLLNGSACSGRRSSVELLAMLTGNKLVKLSMNKSSDAMDLLGSFEQDITPLHSSYSQFYKLVKLLQSKNLNILTYLTAIKYTEDDKFDSNEINCLLKHVCTELQSSGVCSSEELSSILEINSTRGKDTSRFVWKDSELVKAIQNGDWVMLENVNMCSAAITDRLNSLLEPNGKLLISERGQLDDGSSYVISPHSNFRIFFIMDPSFGDISAALRNRMVEIYYDKEQFLRNVELSECSVNDDEMSIEAIYLHEKTFTSQLLCWNSLALLRQCWFLFDKLIPQCCASLISACERCDNSALNNLLEVDNSVLPNITGLECVKDRLHLILKRNQYEADELHQIMFSDIYIANVRDEVALKRSLLAIRALIYFPDVNFVDDAFKSDCEINSAIFVIFEKFLDVIDHISLYRCLDIIHDLTFLCDTKDSEFLFFKLLCIINHNEIKDIIIKESGIHTTFNGMLNLKLVEDLESYWNVTEKSVCYNHNAWSKCSWKRLERLRADIIYPSDVNSLRICQSFFTKMRCLGESSIYDILSNVDCNRSFDSMMIKVACVHQICIAQGVHCFSHTLPGYQIINSLLFDESDLFCRYLCNCSRLIEHYLNTIDQFAFDNIPYNEQLLTIKRQNYQCNRNNFITHFVNQPIFLNNFKIASDINDVLIMCLRHSCLTKRQSQRKLNDAREMSNEYSTTYKQYLKQVGEVIPTFPFDPSKYASFVTANIKLKIKRTYEEMKFRRDISVLENGTYPITNDYHPWTNTQNEFIDNLTDQLKVYERRCYNRASNEEYAVLVEKLKRFANTMLNDANESFSYEWQKSIINFVYDIRKSYIEFPEIVVPFSCAVASLLQFVQCNISESNSKNISHLKKLKQLLSFPFDLSVITDGFFTNDKYFVEWMLKDARLFSVCSQIYIELLKFGLNNLINVHDGTIALLDLLYKQWNDNSTINSGDSVSYVYKQRSSVFHCFQFDFLTAYSDIVDIKTKSNDEDYSDSDDNNESNTETHVDSISILKLYNLSFNLLERRCTTFDYNDLFNLQLHLGDLFVENCEKFDEVLLLYLYTRKSSNDLCDCNFYASSNEAQVVRLLPILDKLRNAILHRLQNGFENHPVLIQLNKIIDRLHTTYINQPLAKFLCGLDILTGIIQNDWEFNVPRAFSLHDELKDLLQITIEWRRLEIRCWSQLIHLESEQIKNDLICETWLPIVNVIKRMQLQDSDSINDCLRCVEKFLADSTLGDCRQRVHIVQVSLFMLQLPYKISRPISNLTDKFSSLCIPIEKIFETETAYICKQLKDNTELSRWSDLNYFMAQDSCRKNKKSLRNHVSKFRSVYCQSMKDRLSAAILNCPEKLMDIPATVVSLLRSNEIDEIPVISKLFDVHRGVTDLCKQFLQIPCTNTIDNKDRKSKLKHYKQTICTRRNIINDCMILFYGLDINCRRTDIDIPHLSDVCSLPYLPNPMVPREWWFEMKNLLWQCWNKSEYLLQLKYNESIAHNIVYDACVMIRNLIYFLSKYCILIEQCLNAVNVEQKQDSTDHHEIILKKQQCLIEQVLKADHCQNINSIECQFSQSGNRADDKNTNIYCLCCCESIKNSLNSLESNTFDIKSTHCERSCLEAATFISIEKMRCLSWLIFSLVDFFHLVWTKGLNHGMDDITEQETNEILQDSPAGFDEAGEDSNISQAKDVSDEIEFEDQIEGLKQLDDDNEEACEQNDSEGQNADGIEMTENFKGNEEEQDNRSDDDHDNKDEDNPDEDMQEEFGTDVNGNDKPYNDEMVADEENSRSGCEDKDEDETGTDKKKTSDLVAQDGTNWVSDVESDLDSANNEEASCDELFDEDIAEQIDEEANENDVNEEAGDDDNYSDEDMNADNNDKESDSFPQADNPDVDDNEDGDAEDGDTKSKVTPDSSSNTEQCDVRDKSCVDTEHSSLQNEQAASFSNNVPNDQQSEETDMQLNRINEKSELQVKDNLGQFHQNIGSTASDNCKPALGRDIVNHQDNDNVDVQESEVLKQPNASELLDSTETMKFADGVYDRNTSDDNRKSGLRSDETHDDRNDNKLAKLCEIDQSPIDEHMVNEMYNDNEWQASVLRTSQLSNELCERLRVILSPTKAAGFSGFYRSGRKLSIKRVVAYVASDFRKDRIWLRRQKQVDRDLQVLMAIDNSRSMNRLRKAVPDSLSTLLASMRLLGGSSNSMLLGMFTFGEQCNLLRNLSTPCSSFTDSNDGPKLIHSLTFNESVTDYIQMLEFADNQFKSITPSAYRLLIVLSDGFVTGHESSISAKIRSLAEDQSVFVVFIALDDLDPQKSLTTIKQATFKDDGTVEFKSILSEFPFPYYVIVNDSNKLPHILADSLCQWISYINDICRC